MSFKVGQKVVCVDNSKMTQLISLGYSLPDINSIYIISGIRFEQVQLKEYGNIGWFNINCFRPLDETFADEVLERIKEEINEEQLVRI